MWLISIAQGEFIPCATRLRGRPITLPGVNIGEKKNKRTEQVRDRQTACPQVCASEGWSEKDRSPETAALDA
jgi:hypothetical protein